MQRVNLLYALFCPFFFLSCERQAGDIIDTATKRQGSLEILAVHKSISYYPDEFVTHFYCRSAKTIEFSAKKMANSMYEQSELQKAGFVWFGLKSSNHKSLDAEAAFRDFVFVDDNAVYRQDVLIVSINACINVVSFNSREETKLYLNLDKDKIDFPDNEYVVGEPFFLNLKVQSNYGCFEINKKYVYSENSYYYCTNNYGEKWSLETTRDHTKHLPPTIQTELQKELRKINYYKGEDVIFCDSKKRHIARNKCPEAVQYIKSKSN
jgi:hypothetical protein